MPLASNWREIGDLHICGRSGLDTNPLTDSSPGKTLTKLLDSYSFGDTALVRAGYYNEGNITAQQSSQIEFIADGLVIWDASGFPQTFSSNLATTLIFQRLIFENHSDFNSTESNNRFRSFNNCIFNNSNIALVGTGGVGVVICNFNLAVDSLFKLISKVSVGRWTFINSIIENGDQVVYSNCAYNKTSALSASGNKTNTLSNCAFETSNSTSFSISSIDIKDITLDSDSMSIGDSYLEGQKFSGTYTDANNNVFTFTNCMWLSDFGFNSEVLGNFTLKLTPQSSLFNNNDIIGVYGLAKIISPNDEAFNPSNSGVNYLNVTRDLVNGLFEITAGAEGSVTSSDDIAHAIDLEEERSILEAIQFFGSKSYFNGEWIDRENYTPLLNEEVRLTYRLQIYNISTNTWSDWYEMEADIKPELDTANRGNGNVDIDFSSVSDIKGRYFRLELTFRNNGV